MLHHRILHTHTDCCTSMFVRTFIAIMHSPVPILKHPSWPPDPDHNLNPIRIPTLKQRLHPRTDLWSYEDRLKRPHFPKISSLSRTGVLILSDATSTIPPTTHTHTHTHTHTYTHTQSCPKSTKRSIASDMSGLLWGGTTFGIQPKQDQHVFFHSYYHFLTLCAQSFGFCSDEDLLKHSLGTNP